MMPNAVLNALMELYLKHREPYLKHLLLNFQIIKSILRYLIMIIKSSKVLTLSRVNNKRKN